MARILIVEDDGMIACDLHSIVDGAGHAVIGPVASVREAQALLARCEAALLDVDVRDGKTFDLALALANRGQPFVFVTGSLPQDVPTALRAVPFLPKPFREADICRWLSRIERPATAPAFVTAEPVPA
ncbi:response regulator [Blastochloris viridis]|uniref:Response regulator n=1 Tax=Blastochloris viridis TaxID=1079 RepID=A0A0H5BCF4_BLAVI|nr:response regulator [Blastochloris viridis]ALK07919.1 two-component response regulator [Blastochloris viridis]BAR98829.1 response regulator [Blastochloris viridis]CUU43841.1 response regulator [Blastochloris viridis]